MQSRGTRRKIVTEPGKHLKHIVHLCLRKRRRRSARTYWDQSRCHKNVGEGVDFWVFIDLWRTFMHYHACITGTYSFGGFNPATSPQAKYVHGRSGLKQIMMTKWLGLSEDVCTTQRGINRRNRLQLQVEIERWGRWTIEWLESPCPHVHVQVRMQPIFP